MNDSLLPACYMVFSGDDNSPAGGMRDLHSIHNSLDDAMASVARLDCGDWWHLAVVDDRGTHIAARGAIEVDDNDTVIVSIVDIAADSPLNVRIDFDDNGVDVDDDHVVEVPAVVDPHSVRATLYCCVADVTTMSDEIFADMLNAANFDPDDFGTFADPAIFDGDVYDVAVTFDIPVARHQIADALKYFAVANLRQAEFILIRGVDSIGELSTMTDESCTWIASIDTTKSRSHRTAASIISDELHHFLFFGSDTRMDGSQAIDGFAVAPFVAVA